MVVPSTMRPISSGVSALWPMASSGAAAGCCGVEGTLTVRIRPLRSSSATRSVKVPPVSMPTLYILGLPGLAASSTRPAAFAAANSARTRRFTSAHLSSQNISPGNSSSTQYSRAIMMPQKEQLKIRVSYQARSNGTHLPLISGRLPASLGRPRHFHGRGGSRVNRGGRFAARARLTSRAPAR